MKRQHFIAPTGQNIIEHASFEAIRQPSRRVLNKLCTLDVPTNSLIEQHITFSMQCCFTSIMLCAWRVAFHSINSMQRRLGPFTRTLSFEPQVSGIRSITLVAPIRLFVASHL